MISRIVVNERGVSLASMTAGYEGWNRASEPVGRVGLHMRRSAPVGVFTVAKRTGEIEVSAMKEKTFVRRGGAEGVLISNTEASMRLLLAATSQP